jgi:tetratricopeptide (TPR) repeat protein
MVAALSKLEEPEKALAAFEKATRTNPKYAKTWYNKGRSLEKIDKTKAQNAYKKVVLSYLYI